MSDAPTSLLSVQDLTVSFGALSVVHNVSFDLRPGEVLAIVGESGSGKSIICRALLGLLPAHAKVSGRILFDGLIFCPVSRLRCERCVAVICR
jgi:ABC-type glutathione transport system ATPase component